MPGNYRSRIELLPAVLLTAKSVPADLPRPGSPADRHALDFALEQAPQATQSAAVLVAEASAPIARRDSLSSADEGSPPPAAVSETRDSRDARRRQIADLQRLANKLRQQNAHRMQELFEHAGEMERSSPDRATARAETDQLRRDIKNLGQQIADLQQLLAERSQVLGVPQHDINALDLSAQEHQSSVAARSAYVAAVAEQNAVQDTLRRQVADLLQQGAQQSQALDAARAELAQLRKVIDASDLLPQVQHAEAPASGPPVAVLAEQSAAQDALRRQVADLQKQTAQRSRDLDAARAEAGNLGQDIDALNLLPQEQEPEAALSGASAAILAEQRAGQDALRRQVTELQQQGAQRSQDLDKAREETAKLRMDIAALELVHKTQEQQAAAPTARMPMADAAGVRPPDAAPVTDTARTPATTTLPPPGEVADAAAITGPPGDSAEAVAVTRRPRLPSATGAPPVQLDQADPGAPAAAPQPAAESRMEATVVTEGPGRMRISPDPAHKQTAKPTASRAIAFGARATTARPCAPSSGGIDCPANDRRGQAAERPMPIEINAVRAAPGRCVVILKRVQLGEALTDDDRTVLRTNCGPG